MRNQNKYFGAVILIIFIGAAALGLARIKQPAATFNSAIACRGCNVVIIGVDTMRADHVHSFGYNRDTTATLDQLASKGFIFTNAVSPASWTVPSFMSIFTGAYPSVHGITNKFAVFNKTEQKLSNLKKISPGIKTLAEAMKDNGYATGGFTGDAGVSGKFGYNQGFDVYTDEQTFGGFDNSEKHALAWLDSIKGKKFFMFFHGYDLHGQFPDAPDYKSIYSPPNYAGPYKGTPKEEAELREQQLVGPISLSPADVLFWKALYDGKIHDADARLKNFLDELGKRGLVKNTMIVVLSDHGEEFYDHGGIDHGHSLYDEQIRIPLIFVIPGTAGGKVIASQVGTIDLMPTIFQILGVKADNDIEKQIAGRKSLVPFMENKNEAGYDVFSETDYRNFTHKASVRAANGWKFILTRESGREELYNLNADPTETNNLLSKELKKADELRAELRRHMLDDLGINPNAPVITGCLPVYDGECK